MIISLDKYKATGGGGGEKPTEVLTKTITDNGSQTFNPQEGYVFSKATITTDVHPTEALVATIDKNSTYHFIGEYNGADITTDVHPTEALVTTINENGIRHFDGEYNGAEITVNVQPSDNYSYFDGVVDVEGLRAIGWDDASIGMYRDNNLHYSWKNSDYIVSEENKALNGVIVDSTSIQNNKDNPNFKYCPFFDTSNVTDMQNMFKGCSSLTSIPLLDTSNVNNMYNMFNGCSSLTSIPLLDTSNVTDMQTMFKGCSSLTSIPALDTSKVTYMSYMFNGCSSLTSLPLLDTSNVMNMEYMFNGCSSLTSIPALDTSKVTNMSWMLYSCDSLTSIALLDTTNVTDMSYLFGWSNNNTLTDLGGFKNLSISVDSYFLDRCPNLTVESLMNVINNLATVSGKTLKFGSTNLNKLTAEQIAIATNKGWTLT